ncbi:MAG: hypothetical protein ACXAC5_01905 [Promethearchaeota archaeon]
MDVACFSLRWDGGTPIVNAISREQLEALPEWVTDTINIGVTCVCDGIMYGPSEKSLKGEPLWSN